MTSLISEIDECDLYDKWKTAVINNNTFLGYWEWCEKQKIIQEINSNNVKNKSGEDIINYIERIAHTNQSSRFSTKK
jgi:hypothetical protein